MNLIFRPGRLTDLPAALDCIRGSRYYSEDLCQRAKLLAFWQYVLSNDLGICGVLEDRDESFGYRMVAFGIGAFVHEWFLDRLLNDDYIFLCDHLSDPCITALRPFLTLAQVREANANAGLNLITINSGCPPALLIAPEAAALRDQAGRFNHFGTAGYRLNLHITEFFGSMEEQWGKNMGLEPWRMSDKTADGLDFKPGLMVVTKEMAERSPGTMMGTSFRFQTPKCDFTKGEQELLLYALSGITDEELAEYLCISVPTVRKRWQSIYIRALRAGVLGESHLSNGSRSRIQHKKPRLLNYLEYHMEELRPYQHVKN